MPAQLSKIVYAIDEKNLAFKAIKLVFESQNFDSWDLEATSSPKRQVCHVNGRMPIRTIRIKQKNNVDGVSQICGLCFRDEEGKDIVLIDPCPGYGQWRTQKLEPDEQIIGMHCYLIAEDED